MTGSAVSTGYLFNRLTMAVLGLAALWAAWAGLTGLVLLCGLVLASAGITRSWSLICLKGVSFHRALDKTRVFPGQTIQASIKISNRKLLPLFWLQVDEQIPAKMTTDESLVASKRPGFSLFSSTLSLTGYSSAAWQHSLTCAKRGYYPLGPVSLTSGDMFGFYSQTTTIPGSEAIIVFPKAYDLVSDNFPFHSPLGESKADQNIYHDPSRVVGLRDYTPQDSLRHVHWKASARRRQLQVKVFESTITIKTAIFISVGSFQKKPAAARYFEDALSTAASIAIKLIERKSHVGLYANTRQAGSGLPVSLSPKNNHDHLMEILETLARTNFSVTKSFKDLLLEQITVLPWGSTIVLILQHPDEDTLQMIDELKAEGHKIMVLDMGDQASEDIEQKRGGIKQIGSDHFQVQIDQPQGILNFRKLAQ